MRRETLFVVAAALRKAAEDIAAGKAPEQLRKLGAERRAARWHVVKSRREQQRYGGTAKRVDDGWADPSALLPVRRELPAVA